MTARKYRERERERQGRTLGPTPVYVIGADGCRWNVETFWSQVDKSSDCWLWTGAQNKGYGKYAGKGGAHRIAYRIEIGPIPKGLELDHLCNMPLCVNPGHLEPVTRAENARRRAARRTHCKHGHPFTPENTYIWPRPDSEQIQRACKTCTKARSAAQRDRARRKVVSL